MKQSKLARNGARGVALPTALVFLIVITLLALSAVRFSSASVRAASNEELRVLSFVTAQSAIEGTIAVPANTPVTAGSGQVYCTTTAGCDNAIIALPDTLAEEADRLQVRVQRLAPALAPPPRGAGASLTRFYAATFGVQAAHDGTGNGYGRTRIDEGLILVLPQQ